MDCFDSRIRRIFNKYSIIILFFLILSSVLFFFIARNDYEYPNDPKVETSNDIDDYPKISSLAGFINLTNSQINKTRHYHNDTITIEGRIYNISNPSEGFPNYNVSLFVNGSIFQNFNDTTVANGEFKINFTIPFYFDVDAQYKIEVNITDYIYPLIFWKENHFLIYTNATSYFDIGISSPMLPGEDYNIPGFLRYDNQNGAGIPDKQIKSNWINGTTPLPPNDPFLTASDGSFPADIQVPNDNHSDMLYLNISYSGIIPHINGSKTEIAVRLFRNITCIWNTASSGTEGAQIVIQGQILDSNNTNIKINNRLVNIYYDNQPRGTATTNLNGDFQFTFNIPSGLGNKPIYVEVDNSLGLNIQSNTTHYISITGAIASETSSPSGKDEPKDPPFFNFFLVLIPIIIGGVAAFAIYAYFFLKKQKEASNVVKLPLESRIRNLKILKDTGRLEEALSYLFQSIYLELINAKYSRIKKPTETIRDFAIISVKELNLKPSNIYPFIQNVEKIIYDRPFIIEENDFYTAVALFSPIYFDLTGYNFILNF